MLTNRRALFVEREVGLIGTAHCGKNRLIILESPYFQLFSSLFFAQLNVVELCVFNMADSHLSQDEVAEIRESFSQVNILSQAHFQLKLSLAHFITITLL